MTNSKMFLSMASKSAEPRSLLFSVPHKVGSLQNALAVFARHGVNLSQLESRPSTSSPVLQELLPRTFDQERCGKVFDFAVNIDKGVTGESVDRAVQELIDTNIVAHVTYLGDEKIPWFPRRIRDLDDFNQECMEAGGDLQSDHPGFQDKEYRKRRGEIAAIARNYKHGQPIPRIQYTKDEIATWRVIYEKLMSLYPKHACAELNYVMPLLQQNCGYGPNSIPQLEDVNNFLKETTGFKIRPTAGLLTLRDFLNGLAFRVFHSTQYIRHHSKPFYTPEPDVVHELMGHAPMFADQDFADFSQEIGLASLGASDEVVQKLGTLYWYTVEFGLCKQNGERKAFGAGLLSSFGELEYCMTDKPEIRPFDPWQACQVPYPITTYQPMYWLCESFERMKEQIRMFAASTPRPFAVRYNPYTESIQVLNNRRELIQMAKNIKSQCSVLQSAIERIEHLDRSSLVFAETNPESTKKQPTGDLFSAYPGAQEAKLE